MSEMTLALGTTLLLEQIRRQERRTHQEMNSEYRDLSSEFDRAPVEPPRLRRYLALKRILNADCPSCRGFGCETCADTGMA